MNKLSFLSLTLLFFTACNNTTATALEPKVEKPQAPKIITAPLPSVEKPTISIPSDSSQLLLVTTDNWSTKNGTLQRYERTNNQWVKVGESLSIVIGRNGLGWGKGLHTTPSNAQYIKKEGDGKAPAGLFSLGSGFGYSSTNFEMKFPYATYKTTDHCVDDSSSQWYNQIIDSKKIAKDYKSFEHMKMRNNLYKYGITVNHNPQQITQGGSCIFIHIKNKSGKGTAGCTAMREDEIVTILKWLKENKKPLLLQLPEEEMVKVHLN
ncbi:MAG: Gll0911 protein [uncultured Sulfurovum sp.]|uniref:Gll0911 protein n=1 Tax=uncultured Sulfurovum sp. TaxID=269237 RepID=A0A6S6T1V0_9BACT|nr:MAG: Gll0911 protein [uncultured Sulfurovum sp.]